MDSYYFANKDRIQAYVKKRRETDPLFRRKAQIAVIRVRAKQKGLPFDLTVEDVEWPEVCPILNIPLNYQATANGPDSPSVDRIVPELGYTLTNCRVISNLANSMKQNATFDQLVTFSKNIRKYLEKV